MSRRITVFGPAYLDRVIRVDQPLHDPESESPLDQSVDGVARFGAGTTLRLRDPSGFEIELQPPIDWPGPFGQIELDRTIATKQLAARRLRVVGADWQDDLGGMGAGFASVLKGTLICALGDQTDAASHTVLSFLSKADIDCQPIRVAERAADWTLLISSGNFGDKLPIGFRGCHASVNPSRFAGLEGPDSEVIVVASLPNTISEAILEKTDAPLRVFAPTTRNMVDFACPVARFARSIDVMSCNQREWDSLENREEVAWRVSILVVTDGPNGSLARFTTPTGEPGQIRLPSFPRARPPRDTNRAGEAYASSLISTLIEHGWNARQGVIDESLIRHAALRASAAAGLTLDRTDFGFPDREEIDEALAAGRIT